MRSGAELGLDPNACPGQTLGRVDDPTKTVHICCEGWPVGRTRVTTMVLPGRSTHPYLVGTAEFAKLFGPLPVGARIAEHFAGAGGESEVPPCPPVAYTSEKE